MCTKGEGGEIVDTGHGKGGDIVSRYESYKDWLLGRSQTSRGTQRFMGSAGAQTTRRQKSAGQNKDRRIRYNWRCFRDTLMPQTCFASMARGRMRRVGTSVALGKTSRARTHSQITDSKGEGILGGHTVTVYPEEMSRDRWRLAIRTQMF